ncbi:MAG: hypothetical protein Q7V15_15475 [Phenylobacterium sp.]|uniref:CC0125/CC1285 family lipoprotein n=1 Tax=Phenylobacterium sp. TaxID=1871053 RepID=UPI00271B57F1|nr:hypothetical protein [Phenylobacterium sp.]MDO8902745.1 hypothetical protein [Phenylobacterium sp.]MDP2214588.1 hypothetical protein [Phenylobacterium sp.]
MKRVLACLSLLAILGGCAMAGTPYGPAYGPRGAGFSEYRIEPGRFRVTYQGGPGAPPQQVADYALLRAAELTLAEGYDWFRITDRASSGRPGGGPRVSLGTGGGSYGGRTAIGVGVGTSLSLGGGPALVQSLEVVMGQGQRPADPNAYDARGVRDSLRPNA